MAKFMRQMPLIRQIQILLGRTGWAPVLNDGENMQIFIEEINFHPMKPIGAIV